MKFALLGIDAEALQLVREIAHSGEHALAYFILGLPPGAKPQAETLQLAAEVLTLCPLAAEPSGWEAFLEPDYCDAVIVAGPPIDNRFEQLRRLAQEAIPVVVTHPAPISLLEAYELEMVRQETRGIVFALLLPWRQHIWDGERVPQLGEAQADAPPLGRIEQITWQRRLPDRRRETVLACLARDFDLIRSLCGEITQVAALGTMPAATAAGARDYSALSVQMSGPQRVLVRWSVHPPDDEPPWTITLVGNEGRHRVEIDEASQSGPAHARYIIENASPPVDGDVASLPNRLDTVFAQLQLRKSGLAHPSNWPEAIRTLELLEGVEKSLAKGRTISVGVEGRSETDAFKGTMASLGCSLLILGLVIMVAGEAAAKVAEKAGMPLLRNVFRWWPALLLILFLVFLVLQLFRYVIPKPPK